MKVKLVTVLSIFKIILMEISVQQTGFYSLKSRISTEGSACYEKFFQIESMLVNLQKEANEKKKACISAFSKYVEEFQSWMEILHSRLLSRKLITFDIVGSEENLLVS